MKYSFPNAQFLSFFLTERNRCKIEKTQLDGFLFTNIPDENHTLHI